MRGMQRRDPCGRGRVSLAPVDGFGCCQVLRLAVGVQCRVDAFSVSGLPELAIFFITVSHCAWQRVVSFSKAKKKRSKENALTALP